ncbi:MAG: hypothetical protein KBB86_02230 [Candidatus Pacebacteria bacterium]|nr:hypothetical protein [Candidatus Paceibacterota bacterium]
MDFSTHHNKDVIFLLIITLFAATSAIYIVWKANKTILYLDNISNIASVEAIK